MEYAKCGVILCILCVLAFMDIRKRSVSLGILIMFGLSVITMLAVKASIAVAEEGWNLGKQILLTGFLGAVPGVLLWGFGKLTGKIGPADGILLAEIGMTETYLFGVGTLCVAIALMAVVSGILLALRKVNRNTRLPFLPCLTAGYLGCAVFMLTG